jgi:hypothetical protein
VSLIALIYKWVQSAFLSKNMFLGILTLGSSFKDETYDELVDVRLLALGNLPVCTVAQGTQIPSIAMAIPHYSK